uniref:Uncharacterized protein n=1 Tax=Aegilops tauschii TaxID=37682 RepID=M8AH38_AEGTA
MGIQRYDPLQPAVGGAAYNDAAQLGAATGGLAGAACLHPAALLDDELQPFSLEVHPGRGGMHPMANADDKKQP